MLFAFITIFIIVLVTSYILFENHNKAIFKTDKTAETHSNSNLKSKRSLSEINDEVTIAQDELSLFFNDQTFIDEKSLSVHVKGYEALVDECFEHLKRMNHLKGIFQRDTANEDVNIKASLEAFRKRYSHLSDERKQHNETYTQSELMKYDVLFSDVEGKSMDINQRKSAINDDNNILINAGAGSGKTLTLLGKIKYLIECKGVKPDEILVLMYNNKNAKEFNERTKALFDIDQIAFTFHSLGMQMILKDNPKAKVDQYALEKFVEKVFNELDASPKRLEKYLEFLTFYFSAYLEAYDKDVNEAKLDEMIERRSNQKYITLLGEITDSFEEKLISDYYYMKGIKYSISVPYESPVSSEGKRIYCPDFSFPEYKGIYHEHFGVDENGKVPPFFKGNGEKTAQEIYEEGMTWKRKTHEENETLLLETYSYQYRDGTLFEAIDKNLKRAGILDKGKQKSRMWSELKVSHSSSVASFKKLLKAAVEQLKSNNSTISELKTRNKQVLNPVEKRRNQLILDLVEDIYIDYNAALKNSAGIDFNDMILDAYYLIKANKVVTPYKYIIVDEYQDISKLRFDLLKAIQKQSDAKLIAVGDDWQSIFRFSGSRVSLFTEFDKLNEHASMLSITQTFRYDQKVANVAKKFITRNPSQLEKQVVSKVVKEGAGVFPIYTSDLTEYIERFKLILEDIPRKEAPESKTSVMIISRYNRDIDFVIERGGLEGSRFDLSYSIRPDLLISYSAIHSSKGLEADYVIILNNREGQFGFPSKMEDDRFFNLLSPVDEVYPYAEERRLMYVALTRTKQACYLMIESTNKSTFIKELEKQEGWEDPYKVETVPCPKCLNGDLVLRTSMYGEFHGCSRYPKCDYKKNLKREDIA